MYETRPSTAQTASSGGIRVAAPCAGDVLSGALQTAYERDRTLPDDMLGLLAQLDVMDALRS